MAGMSVFTCIGSPPSYAISAVTGQEYYKGAGGKTTLETPKEERIVVVHKALCDKRVLPLGTKIVQNKMWPES